MQTKAQRGDGVWFVWVLFLHGMRVVLLCLSSSSHRGNFLVGLSYQHRNSSPIHRQAGAPAAAVPGNQAMQEVQQKAEGCCGVCRVRDSIPGRRAVTACSNPPGGSQSLGLFVCFLYRMQRPGQQLEGVTTTADTKPLPAVWD